jgi:hypothetical protein
MGAARAFEKMAKDRLETIASGIIRGAQASVAAAWLGYFAHYDLGF